MQELQFLLPHSNYCPFTRALRNGKRCHAKYSTVLFAVGRLKYLTLTDPTKVWMPDTFFRNEKEARKHEIIVPNVYVRIFPNGEILYSIR